MAPALVRCAVILGVGVVTSGCASLDDAAIAETHRLEDAPYYVDVAEPRPKVGSCAIVLPVTLDPKLVDQFGYGDRAPEFEPILRALQAAVPSSGCVRSAEVPVTGRAPRVFVGSADSEYAPPEAATQRLDTDRFSPMILHLERADAAWTEGATRAAADSGAPYVIQAQLGVSQYMKGYSGAFRKEVVLGTGHRVPIRFLTAEDKPVEVLHLTGVLVDAGGRPARAGAEGIVLRDTPFLAQTVDATRTFDVEELQRITTAARRDDLPGAPLALQVALDNLLAQLTRGAVTVPAR